MLLLLGKQKAVYSKINPQGREALRKKGKQDRDRDLRALDFLPPSTAGLDLERGDGGNSGPAHPAPRRTEGRPLTPRRQSCKIRKVKDDM